jgi:K+-sensing histidine kinase KdpD
MSKPEISSVRALSPILRYGLALACPCVALAVALLLVPYGFTNSVFLFGIAIVIWFAGPGPAVLAVLISTAARDYFFIEPLYSFVIRPSDIPHFIIFLLFASLIMGFAAVRRRASPHPGTPASGRHVRPRAVEGPRWTGAVIPCPGGGIWRGDREQ